MTRIALLADVHANYPALKAVSEEVISWEPDEVFVLGDSINRGPRPRDCLQFLLQMRREKGWQIIRGNHEEYVLQFEDEGAPKSGPAFEILRFVSWTHQKLTPQELETVEQFPAQIDQTLQSGHQLRAVHASMAGMRAGIYPGTPQENLPEMIKPAPDIFCVGHTHNPLLRHAGKTKIINAGSSGLPFDGDPRPSYIRLHTQPNDVQAEIRRVDYDRQKAVQDFYQTNFLPEGGPMVKIILQELLTARPLISRWNQRYEQAVLNQELTLDQSVNLFLREHDHHPPP